MGKLWEICLNKMYHNVWNQTLNKAIAHSINDIVFNIQGPCYTYLVPLPTCLPSTYGIKCNTISKAFKQCDDKQAL